MSSKYQDSYSESANCFCQTLQTLTCRYQQTSSISNDSGVRGQTQRYFLFFAKLKLRCKVESKVNWSHVANTHTSYLTQFNPQFSLTGSLSLFRQRSSDGGVTLQRNTRFWRRTGSSWWWTGSQTDWDTLQVRLHTHTHTIKAKTFPLWLNSLRMKRKLKHQTSLPVSLNSWTGDGHVTLTQ